jgi:hypothetical protein
MSDRRVFPLALVALAMVRLLSSTAAAQTNGKYQYVLLISIDGMHSLDFANCSKGVAIYGNQTYCPHLASLSSTGVHYLQAFIPNLPIRFLGSLLKSRAGRRVPLECTTT